MNECVVCGFPTFRLKGHADWCESVGRLNAVVYGGETSTWVGADLVRRRQRERPAVTLDRVCPWDGCDLVFRITNPNQRYCGPEHSQLARKTQKARRTNRVAA